MNSRSIFVMSTVGFFLFSWFLSPSTFAAGTIPRDDLRLELVLATGSRDTSGLSRVVTATGLTPTYTVDSLYGVPYAKFSGSGGLKVNTSWSSSVDNFTISFWMRHSGTFFTGATTFTGATKQIRIEGSCPSCPTDYRDDVYNSNLAQTVFTTGEEGGMKLVLDARGKCSLRGGSGTILSQSIFLGSVRNLANIWTNVYRNEYKAYDVGTNMQESFSCSQLLDNKWHNVMLIRRPTGLSFNIDGAEVAKLTTTPFSIGRNLTLGYSDTNTASYSGKFSTSELNILSNSKYLRGSLAGFRIYSRALTDLELESVYDEYRYSQSELLGAGNIQVTMDKYTTPNVFINLKSIPLSLAKENVTYEYSTNTTTFTPITNITNVSTSTGSLDYKVGINLSDKPDGKITLTLRIRGTNQSFQNIGTVSFTKLDNSTVIDIVMPSGELATSKTIVAYATGAQLSMLVTTSTLCDVGMNGFEEYSDLTFTNKADNGKRVCYKAIYSATNKTIYKLSATIQGIQSLEDKTTTSNSKLFDTYLLWARSNYQKVSDTTSLILDLLSVAAGSSNGTINGVTMTDINGDGLVDFLYSRNDPVRRAIIVNNGNYTFRTVYKCAIDPLKDAYGNIVAGGAPTYYGDCADPTR